MSMSMSILATIWLDCIFLFHHHHHLLDFVHVIYLIDIWLFLTSHEIRVL